MLEIKILEGKIRSLIKNNRRLRQENQKLLKGNDALQGKMASRKQDNDTITSALEGAIKKLDRFVDSP